MTHLDDEVLARALAVICGDQSRRRGDIVTDPYTPLDKADIPRSAVVQLIQRGCLIGRGSLRFEIARTELPPPKQPRAAVPVVVRPTPAPSEADDAPASLRAPDPPPVPPAPTPTLSSVAPAAGPTTPTPPAERPPRLLLIIDVENTAKTCRDLHAPFRPERIRELAAKHGEIAFGFACANVFALSPGDREAITGTAFPLVHCQRLRDGNGGKDTVDEHVADLIRRFLACGAVDGVVLVTDDRNFIPIMMGVLDQGRRLIRIAVRRSTELDRIGEVWYLPLHETDEAVEATPAAARRWDAHTFIEDLHELIGKNSASERDHAITMLSLRTPLPFRLLRAYMRRWYGTRHAEWKVSFTTLLDELSTMVLPDDRAHVSPDDLTVFLTALIDIGVITRVETPKPGGRVQRGYHPNWEHPFCGHAIADIRAQGSRWRRGRGGENGRHDRRGAGAPANGGVSAARDSNRSDDPPRE